MERSDAYSRRIRIEQAKGALAQVHSVSVDEAFAVLLFYVVTHHQSLGDVAWTVVEDPARLPDLMSPRSDV